MQNVLQQSGLKRLFVGIVVALMALLNNEDLVYFSLEFQNGPPKARVANVVVDHDDLLTQWRYI